MLDLWQIVALYQVAVRAYFTRGFESRLVERIRTTPVLIESVDELAFAAQCFAQGYNLAGHSAARRAAAALRNL